MSVAFTILLVLYGLLLSAGGRDLTVPQTERSLWRLSLTVVVLASVWLAWKPLAVPAVALVARLSR